MHSSNGTKNVLIGVMFIAAVVSGIWMMRLPQGTGPGSVMSLTQQRTQALGIIGAVASVSGGEITVQSFTFIPATPGNNTVQSKTMTVMVSPSTTVELLTPKDAATMTKERNAFVAMLTKLQAEGKLSASTPLTPPEPFIIKQIRLSDIKVGQTVTAYAASDVSKASSFTATKIDLFNPSKTP